MQKNFVIIGAGITGITTAYQLARLGHSVTVVEAEPYAAMMTSYANGGQLSVSNSETWTTWNNVRKGIKWVFDPGAPLLVRPWPSIPKMKWLAGFLWNTVTNTYEKNTLDTIALGLEAQTLYEQIADEEGISFDKSKCGILHFYKNQDYFDSAIRSTEMYRKLNVDRQIIGAKEVFDIEPTLATDSSIIGGTYTASDSVGDIHKFCNELARVLVNKYFVKIHYGNKIIKVVRDHQAWLMQTENKSTFACANVVICAGARSSEIARMFGENINVYPVKGYSITIQDNVHNLPKVSLLDDEAKIVTSTLGNRLRVAGTAELDDWNRDIRISRIDPLVKWVRQNLPEVNTRDIKPWAGLRPMTPSMMPIVGKGKRPGVWLNTGHGHLGWTLSPATAAKLASLIG